ncbi:GATA transcription factor 8-like [Phragmites australis]|uniref:GATA transcription factor 8-like n=1 Tax=Phragmites australis TaxID=29695 RepID=UPI002D79F7A6|nr:GATA transcription factor 8-like [Phragmites australis]XP_062220654.1 GATA transcription factor 8-like [Phragmites australis]XP_062220655.1 GATA transcription factor 8-like [Phragmites australis]XP_062220656.1 GATA transcription factor 8-like [Phragmites australis]XP_062220657.1 GATA transcription factor 8-like [Phragmites australis]
MASGGFVEEMMREQSLLEATCGDLFDHIDDLLEFPKEDSAADVLLLDAPAPGSPLSARIIDVGAARGNASSQPPPALEPLMALPLPAQDGAAFFDAKNGGHIGSCDDLDMDMAQLEWLSGLFDDTSIPHEPAFPGAAANCAEPIKSSALAANAGVAMLPDKMEEALFRSSSPISVLEQSSFNANNNVGSASSSSSSASSSSESFSGSGGRVWSAPLSPRPEPPVLLIPARARSKRSRASAFSGGRAAEAPTILVPTPMYSSTSSHSDPESIAESNPQPPPPMKKKKAKKPAPAPAASDADVDNDGDADYEEGGGSALPQGAVRRCTHCQIEKTPQWRAGPLGPKTLCNACGVRYKSGRLFPEYRPAASPTFVPSIHSNSHKKVVEMRQKAVRSGDPSCDLLQFIRRRD